eukprot:752875-Hanusia_phi.AAC.1
MALPVVAMTARHGGGAGRDPFASAPRRMKKSRSKTLQGGSFPSLRSSLYEPDGDWGYIPEGEEVAMAGFLEKESVDMTWRRRHVCVTKSRIFFSKDPESPVIDTIPLCEISQVSLNEDGNELDFRGEEEGGKVPKAASHQNFFEKFVKLSSTSLSLNNLTENVRVFHLHTVTGGFNSGRTYILRASSPEVCKSWILAIEEARLKELKRINSMYGTIARVRLKCKRFYDSDAVQFSIGFIIFLNFLCSVLNYELLPQPGSHLDHLFNTFEIAFLSIFAVELALNMFAHWFVPFFTDGWNVSCLPAAA